jgi:hypothetical protein
MGVILIVAGIVGIAGGIFGKSFYSGNILSFSGNEPKQRISTWFGRVLFSVVGAFLIAVGIKLLISAE